MRKDSKKLYREAFIQHKQFDMLFREWQRNENGNYNVFELVDTSYVLREIIKLFEDSLKELKKEEKKAHAKAGLIYLQVHANDEKKPPIKTPHCSANVQADFIPELPKLHKDPERYMEFMDFLGIPSHIRDLDIIRVHWPAFKEYFNRLLAEGYPTPKGLDMEKAFPSFKLSIRKKKDIELE